MSNRKTKTPDATTEATPAQKILERQRKRAQRVLLKRRRQKSHQ